jgi:nitrile hydratase beta subunit
MTAAEQVGVAPRTLGAHDVGGEPGFGRVPVDKDQGATEDWQVRVFALLFSGALNGLYGFGDFRAVGERMHPLTYHNTPYFERLLYAVETNLVKSGVFTPSQIEEWVRTFTENPHALMPEGANDAIAEAFRTIIPVGIADLKAQHDPARPPRFAAGDRVRGVVIEGDGYPRAHARHPGYVQGRPGVIEAAYGMFPTFSPYDLPSGDALEHVYAVRFDATELWPDAEPRTTVLIDLSESYLEPAGEGEEQ